MEWKILALRPENSSVGTLNGKPTNLQYNGGRMVYYPYKETKRNQQKLLI
jgi:hypothetical protein